MNWLWIGGSICIALIAVPAVLLIIVSRRDAAKREKILHEGQTVKCWVAMHIDDQDQCISFAQCVFSPDPKVTDEQLKQLAEALLEYQADENAGEDERFFDMDLRIYQSGLLRIPERITGGLEAYTVAIDVSKLPGKRLNVPYIYCKVLLGEDGGAEQIDYSDQ